MTPRFRDLEEAKAYLISNGHQLKTEILLHCAQSIEYSISGFPELKPWWFRATVGRIAAKVFLRRGFMHHDLNAPIPGGDAGAHDDDVPALDRLLSAIDRFQRHTRKLKPHFAYGSLPKADYDRLHAFHIADHFRGGSK